MASQPEFLMAALAFIILLMFPSTYILVSHSSTIHQMESREYWSNQAYLKIYGLIHTPGDPPDWGTRRDIPSRIGLASAHTRGELDPQKIHRLTPRNPYYIDHSTFSDLLNLRGMKLRLRILPPFNLSLHVERLRTLVISTKTWSGVSYPHVRVRVLFLTYIPAFGFFPIDDVTTETDDDGMAYMRIPLGTRIIVAGAYKDGFFAPAYLVVRVPEDSDIYTMLVESWDGRPGRGHLLVSVFVTNYLSIRRADVVSVFFEKTLDTCVIYQNGTRTGSVSGPYFVLNVTVNVPSRGFSFIIVRIDDLGRVRIAVFPYPPLLGYFENCPAYGDVSHYDFIWRECVVIKGEPYLVVAECEY